MTEEIIISEEAMVALEAVNRFLWDTTDEKPDVSKTIQIMAKRFNENSLHALQEKLIELSFDKHKLEVRNRILELEVDLLSSKVTELREAKIDADALAAENNELHLELIALQSDYDALEAQYY